VGAAALFVAVLLGDVVAAAGLAAALRVGTDAQVILARRRLGQGRPGAHAADGATVLVGWCGDDDALRRRRVVGVSLQHGRALLGSARTPPGGLGALLAR
jgi:hypothetical protein